MNKISKIVCFVIFSALLTSGFPNFMMQEAHAAVPTLTSVKITGGNQITAVFSENVDLTAANGGDFTDFKLSDNSARNITAASGAGTTTIVLTFDGNAVSTSETGTIDIGAGVKSSANNADVFVAVNDQAVTDGQKPTVSVSFDPASGAPDSVTATITWSESVTLFVIGDISVSGGTLSDFSGSGTSYTVTWTQSDLSADDYTFTIAQDSATDGATNTGPASASIATFTRGSSGGGSGCSDCEEPTLGVLSSGQRVVEEGFTYNGYSVDVERFFTPYPLITAQTGKQNTAVFKIYENRGPNNIAHFDFAFGLGKDQIISDSKAMIEVDFARDGTQAVNIVDPENALDNVSVTTDVVACSEGPTQCLEITIKHTFRESLDFDIVGTNVWDHSRQSWQNYYNHGIEVVGPSLNPAKQHDGVNQGHIYHLTEISKTTAVDEFGNAWTFQYGKWMKDYIKQERIQDGQKQVFDRMHSDFADYKENLANEAFSQLAEMCPLCIEEYADFDVATSLEYGNKISKLANPEIQKIMNLQNSKAQEILKYIMDPKLSSSEKYQASIEKDERPISEILAEERMLSQYLQDEHYWLKQIIAPHN